MAEACVTENHITDSSSDKHEHLISQLAVVIDGKDYTVRNGASIWEGCKDLGIHIPTLCHHPRLKPAGRCGVCVVEAKYKGKSPAEVFSCSCSMQEGIVITTGNSDNRVRHLQAKNFAAVMQTRRDRAVLDVEDSDDSVLGMMSKTASESLKDRSTPALVIDQSKCIQCSRCVRACRDIAGMNVFSMPVSPVLQVSPLNLQDDLALNDTNCISCGQCSAVCPSEAIVEKDDIARMVEAINDPDVICVATTAPSVRVAIGEPFGEKPGAAKTETMVGALRALGFDYVFDTNFTADLTIMEEGTEFLTRFKKTLAGENAVFPMFTSCCPGWINMVEKHFPKLFPNLSTCKSPQQMMGALVKTYFCETKKLDPKKVFHVSFMPCTAKKYECSRPEFGRDGYRDVDMVLTTREFARAVKAKNIDWYKIKPSKADDPLGESTSAADIFGVTGGVMEAALRSAMHLLGAPLPKDKLVLNACRGLDGVKEAVIPVPAGGKTHDVKICIVNGGANAKKLCEKVLAGEAFYHFIEVMACPSGCINGGGQPRSEDKDVAFKRMNGIYGIDEKCVLRQSHENRSVLRLYEKFLKEPNSHKAHELLHTTYNDRSRPVKEVEELAPATANSLLVLYGSQTGRTQKIALDLAEELKNVFDVRCVAANDYNVENLNAENVVIFMASTFRDGDFPDNALGFWDALSSKTDETWLTRTKFAVFGLCSKNYPLFNAAAIAVDQKLEALGAIRVAECGVGDDTQPGGLSQQDQFDAWFPANALGVSLTKTVRPKFQLSVAFAAPDPLPPPEGYVYGKVDEEYVLTPDGYERIIKHIGINLKDTGLSYNLGDALSVWPCNDEHLVLSLLGNMKLNPAAVVTISSSLKSSLPKTSSILSLFVKHLDIFKPPSPSALAQFALFARDEKEAAKLLHLSSEEGVEDFKKWLESCPHRAGSPQSIKGYNSIFEDFPSVRPSLDYILQLIPEITPRQYSISSTPSISPDVAELTYIIPTWIRRGGSARARCGLATNYLQQLKKGDKVAVAVHEGIIQLPPTVKPTGIVCVGLGTGLAPMRAVTMEMIHRYKNGLQDKIPMHVYIGCRHEKKETLYPELWKEAVTYGIRYIPAFSHDQKEMILVNHKMAEKEYEKELASIIKDPKAYYFYCGPSAWNLPATMVESFKKSLVDSGLKPKKADDVLFDMKVENRMHVEAFSA